MEKKIYTLKDLEEMLQVSNRTLLTYIKNGRLTAVKIGRKWMVTAENLDSFINGREPQKG